MKCGFLVISRFFEMVAFNDCNDVSTITIFHAIGAYQASKTHTASHSLHAIQALRARHIPLSSQACDASDTSNESHERAAFNAGYALPDGTALQSSEAKKHRKTKPSATSHPLAPAGRKQLLYRFFLMANIVLGRNPRADRQCPAGADVANPLGKWVSIGTCR